MPRPHRGLKLTKLSTPTQPRASTTTMGAAYDFAPERPEHIQQILDGLDRYNPETTGVFQDYVMQQCESQTYDCYANLALLKLYVSHLCFIILSCLLSCLHDDETTTTFPITRGMGTESPHPLKFNY
jgi:hypothetical protein